MEILEISSFDKALVLKDLERFSYIKNSKDGYTMHRLLQEAIRDELFESDEEKVKAIRDVSWAIFRWFEASFSNHKYGSYFANSILQVEFILDKSENLEIDEARIYLYTCLSAFQSTTTSKPKDVLFYIEKSLKLITKIKINNEIASIIYQQYANALELNEKRDEALKYYNKALEFTKNNSYIKKLYTSIGLLYHEQKKYDKALEYYDKSLESRGTNFNNNSANYNNIGLTYTHQGKYKEALEYYQKALDINLLTVVENHPTNSTTYNNIGLVYEFQKKYHKSLEYYQKALDMKLGILNKNHSDIALIYFNIGRVYQALKKCIKAKENLEKSLNIRVELEIDKYILEVKEYIKIIDKNIQKEHKLTYNKKGRYCKDD